jgi:hypothetical protein
MVSPKYAAKQDVGLRSGEFMAAQKKERFDGVIQELAYRWKYPTEHMHGAPRCPPHSSHPGRFFPNRLLDVAAPLRTGKTARENYRKKLKLIKA